MKTFRLFLTLLIAVQFNFQAFDAKAAAISNNTTFSSLEYTAIAIAALGGLIVIGGATAWIVGKFRTNDVFTTPKAQAAFEQTVSTTFTDIPTGNTLSFTAAINNSISTGDISNLQNYLAGDSQLYNFLKPGVLKAAGLSLDIQTNQTAYESLISTLGGPEDTPSALTQAIESTKTLLSSSNGFSADDLLTIASDNSMFGDGYTGTLADKISLVNQAISENELSRADFFNGSQYAPQTQQDATAITAVENGPPGPGEPSNLIPINTGASSLTPSQIRNLPAYEEALQQAKALSAEQLQAQLVSANESINNLSNQIKSLNPGDENYETENAALQEQLEQAQVDAQAAADAIEPVDV